MSTIPFRICRRSCFGAGSTLLALAAFGLAGTAPAHAQITLSHVTAYEVTAAGNFSGNQFWDTIPGGAFDVFIIQGSDVNGTILNGATREPQLSLVNGDNTFTILLEPGALNPNGGLSLFFNDATSASLSGYAPFGTPLTPPNSGTGQTIYNPYGSNSGAGLTFAGPGGATATLTSLSVFNANVNRVSSGSATQGGSNDFGMTFTVNVTGLAAASAPEPGTIALLLSAAVPIAGIVRRRKKH